MTTQEFYLNRLLERLRSGETPAEAYAETYFQVYGDQRISEAELPDALKLLRDLFEEQAVYVFPFDDQTAKAYLNDEDDAETG